MTQTWFLVLLLLLPICELTEDSCDRYGCPGGDYENELISRFRDGCPPELNDIQCASRRAKEVELWLSRNNKFKVLIAGKMGVGKTTLVKGLTEEYDPEEDKDLLPHTVKVTPHILEHNGIELTILDTPGLQDAADGHNDLSYLEDMVKNSQEPDLLIFATRMDDPNFRGDDLAAFSNISSAFGWKVWKNAMTVLTFANKVHLEGEAYDSRENKNYYVRIRSNLAQNITDTLRGLKVQKKVANNIPVIPVGLVKQPIIPSDERKVSWVEEFWKSVHACLKVSRQDKSNTPPPQTCPECPTCPTCSPPPSSPTCAPPPSCPTCAPPPGCPSWQPPGCLVAVAECLKWWE